jgi:hypothetical protein
LREERRGLIQEEVYEERKECNYRHGCPDRGERGKRKALLEGTFRA